MDATKRNYLLMALFVVAVVGIGTVSLMARRTGKTDQGVYAPAMAKLSSANYLDLTVSLDTILRQTIGTGENVEVSETPLNVSGPLRLAYPAGGALTAQANLTFGAVDQSLTLMRLETIIAANGQTYAQVNDLPTELNQSLDIGQLNGNWFSVGSDALAYLLPWLVKSGASDEVVVLSQPINADSVSSTAAGILVPYRRYEDTVIDGRPAAHYEMAVDYELMKKFLTTVTEALRGGRCTDDERQAVARFVDERQMMAEVWIDIERMDVLTITLGLFPNTADGGVPLVLTLSVNGVNQPFSVEPPVDARPLSVVLMKALRLPAISAAE
ncbi:MAG: hypothetical protein V1738_03755 [Patescibacteria group bacterium]